MSNPMQISWKVRTGLRMFGIALLLGAAVGIFVLYPTNEFVYYYEYRPGNSTAANFALSQMHRDRKSVV